MREAVAKTKWCPFGRAPGNDGNRQATGAPSAKSLCLGSDCAAWLWTATPGVNAENDGFCGLVRTP